MDILKGINNKRLLKLLGKTDEELFELLTEINLLQSSRTSSRCARKMLLYKKLDSRTWQYSYGRDPSNPTRPKRVGGS